MRILIAVVAFIMSCLCVGAKEPTSLLGQIVDPESMDKFCDKHNLRLHKRNIDEAFRSDSDANGIGVAWSETITLQSENRKVDYVLTRNGQGMLKTAQDAAGRKGAFRVSVVRIRDKSLSSFFPNQVDWNSTPEWTAKVLGRPEFDFTNDNRDRHVNFWSGAGGGHPFQFTYNANGELIEVLVYYTK